MAVLKFIKPGDKRMKPKLYPWKTWFFISLAANVCSILLYYLRWRYA